MKDIDDTIAALEHARDLLNVYRVRAGISTHDLTNFVCSLANVDQKVRELRAAHRNRIGTPA
jgi:hypothetical protein